MASHLRLLCHVFGLLAVQQLPRAAGVFFSLDPVEIKSDGQTTCGVLHCWEEVQPGSASIISSLTVYKQEAGRRVTLTTVSYKNPVDNRTSDGIRVDGMRTPGKADVKLYLVKKNNCTHVQYTCKVRLTDEQGRKRLSLAVVGGEDVTTPEMSDDTPSPNNDVTTPEMSDDTPLPNNDVTTAEMPDDTPHPSSNFTTPEMSDDTPSPDSEVTTPEMSDDTPSPDSEVTTPEMSGDTLPPDSEVTTPEMSEDTLPPDSEVTTPEMSEDTLPPDSEVTTPEMSDDTPSPGNDRKSSVMSRGARSATDGTCSNDCVDQLVTMIKYVQEQNVKVIKEQMEYVQKALAKDIQSVRETVDSDRWIVIQRRNTFDTDFNRGWNSYKDGFGFPDGEFWLGNDQIHFITSRTPHELRVTLECQGVLYEANYDRFLIDSEDENFKLHVGGYSGTSGDSLTWHNNAMFSTYDRDNDLINKNENNGLSCADFNGGGWWYKNCSHANLNRKWDADYIYQGPIWYSLPQRSKGVTYKATFTEMKIRKRT